MDFNFSIYGTVDDIKALYSRAYQFTHESTGMCPTDIEELLAPDGEPDPCRCIQMLLDPGELAGCSIIESVCE